MQPGARGVRPGVRESSVPFQRGQEVLIAEEEQEQTGVRSGGTPCAVHKRVCHISPSLGKKAVRAAKMRLGCPAIFARSGRLRTRSAPVQRSRGEGAMRSFRGRYRRRSRKGTMNITNARKGVKRPAGITESARPLRKPAHARRHAAQRAGRYRGLMQILRLLARLR